MEQDHLPCSCDQEVFERVWRRVMPEDRPDCPFTLGEDAAAPPAIQPPAVALPAVVHTAPAGEQAPSRPVVGEEHDVTCLGASSAVYGAQLQRLIDRELADWRAYQALSRRAQGNSGRVLATIAADERRHAKRLSTAYFLISGVRYWPEGAAAKAVHAHDFIIELPDGYDTEISERGARLSNGQRQLLAFARTMVSDPRILILDEATSSIDTQTEIQVQQGIESLLKGRTSFIIAHRLSTIKNADRIFVIDHGKIFEQGTHDELMAKQGAYYQLYQAQFRRVS